MLHLRVLRVSAVEVIPPRPQRHEGRRDRLFTGRSAGSAPLREPPFRLSLRVCRIHTIRARIPGSGHQTLLNRE